MMEAMDKDVVLDGKINSKYIVNSLIMFLDGKKDRYYQISNDKAELFQSVYRFRKEDNKKLIQIKKRCLNALRHAYESALYQFWRSLTSHVYETIQVSRG